MNNDKTLRETVERAFKTHKLSPDEVRQFREESSAADPGEFAKMIGCSRQHVYNLERDGAKGMSAVSIASRVYLEHCRRVLDVD